MTVPDFYDPSRAAEFAYRPDAQRVFDEARDVRQARGIAPAASDVRRTHLLLIDVQRDFCFPEGSLYVGGRSGRGAIEDNDRLARFIYANLGALSEITATLDTHLPFQIFFAPFWVDRNGAPLSPHRTVVADQIGSGEVRPNPDIALAVTPGDVRRGAADALAWLTRQAHFYCESLERDGKYTLYLWPPHCLVGGDGHALAGVLHEARLFHAYARSSPNLVEIKGAHALTENYSVFSPEVTFRHDTGSLASLNDAFLDRLLAEDRIVVAGQAASHCVKSSIDDLLKAIEKRDRGLARKVYILEDAMSAVAVPDPARRGAFLADFTDNARTALTRFADAGMNVVRTTTPIDDWPGWGR